MHPDLSVIICTHNPREDFLKRTLDALKEQSLPRDSWELILVDNASKEPLAEKWDLGWHPLGRHIHEQQPGLTSARLCGIGTAVGELLVFVDDDNLLDPKYLETARTIAGQYPWVGAYNGGIVGEFEEQPPEWVRFMLPNLAIRDIRVISWACQPGIAALRSAPCGAGMVIHKRVAEHYADKVRNDPLRLALGRNGNSLAAGEDTDMALCSCEMGLAVGQFPALVLTHLIPQRRIEPDYLIHLAEGMSRSLAILEYIWERKMPKDPRAKPASRLKRVLQNCRRIKAKVRKLYRGEGFREQIRAAYRRGEAQALEILKQYEAEAVQQNAVQQ